MTDLALELAELCDALHVGTGSAGDDFLADQFSVKPWSTEFFQIVFSIAKRAEILQQLVASSGANAAVIAGAEAHLSEMQLAFSKTSLVNSWNSYGAARVGPAHSSPIRMLSLAIAQGHSYPKLSEPEREEVSGMVSQLLEWLRAQQLSDKDFIRESLIEGLEQYLFRLERMKWLGWGYSIEALRDVISAYFALERGIDPVSNPDAAAVLQKVGVTLKKVFSYASTAKDIAETGDWTLSFFRYAASVGSSGGTGFIAGLLAG